MVRKRSPGGGRKPLPKGRQREQVNFRACPELLAQLRQEAEQNGRSLTGEIEVRLQKSFEEPTPQELAFGEGADRGFAVTAVELAQLIRLSFHSSWREDRWTFDLFRAAVQCLLDSVAPAGEAKAPENVKADVEALALAFAAAVVAKMQRVADISWAKAEPDERKYQKMRRDLRPKVLQPRREEERQLSLEERKANQAGILAMFKNLKPEKEEER